MKTITFFFALQSFAETVVDLKTYLREELVGLPTLTKETFTISADQQQKMKQMAENASDESFVFYYGKTKEGKIEKACTAVPQQGKEGPMTVGVCFGMNGVVKSVRILDFSEERGKPVKEKTFLKQFEGKNVANAFQIGKDVDGVTGATISSQAVSEAVRKASFGFKTFVQK